LTVDGRRATKAGIDAAQLVDGEEWTVKGRQSTTDRVALAEK